MKYFTFNRTTITRKSKKQKENKQTNKQTKKWKDPDAGKDWRQEEKRTTEDEIVGCHHRLNGHKFEQALEVGDG